MRKMLRIFLAAAVCAVLSGCANGAGSDGDGGYTYTPASYKITYSTEYGTAPSSKTVESGYALTADDLPKLEADSYSFSYWANGSTSGAKVSEDYKVLKDIVLYAVWIKVENISNASEEAKSATNEAKSKLNDYTTNGNVIKLSDGSTFDLTNAETWPDWLKNLIIASKKDDGTYVSYDESLSEIISAAAGTVEEQNAGALDGFVYVDFPEKNSIDLFAFANSIAYHVQIKNRIIKKGDNFATPYSINNNTISLNFDGSSTTMGELSSDKSKITAAGSSKNLVVNKQTEIDVSGKGTGTLDGSVYFSFDGSDFGLFIFNAGRTCLFSYDLPSKTLKSKFTVCGDYTVNGTGVSIDVNGTKETASILTDKTIGWKKGTLTLVSEDNAYEPVVEEDTVYIELPESVGVNELSGKSGSKPVTGDGYTAEDSWSFDETTYTTKWKSIFTNVTYEKIEEYRYSYDSVNKLLYLAKKSMTEIKNGNSETYNSFAEYKRKNSKQSAYMLECEKAEFNSMWGYKYSFEADSSLKLVDSFAGKMPTYTCSFSDFSGGRLTVYATPNGGWDDGIYEFFLSFEEGTNGAFNGPGFYSCGKDNISQKEAGNIRGTYSVEGNTYGKDGLETDLYIGHGSVEYSFSKTTKTTKIENDKDYVIYSNKAGNTVVTEYYEWYRTPNETTYTVMYSGGNYSIVFNKNNKTATVNHSDGTAEIYENFEDIDRIGLSEDFRSYVITEKNDSQEVIAYHVHSGKDGSEKVLVPYKLNLTFTSVPSGVPLTTNKKYTLY